MFSFEEHYVQKNERNVFYNASQTKEKEISSYI